MNGKNGQNGQNGEDGGYGPQGPTGPSGGPQGSIGPTGPTGNQGLTGPRGIQGFYGQRGNQGSIGDFGPTGPQGNQGDTGPQGNQGSIGILGGPAATNINMNTFQITNASTITSTGTITGESYDVNLDTASTTKTMFSSQTGAVNMFGNITSGNTLRIGNQTGTHSVHVSNIDCNGNQINNSVNNNTGNLQIGNLQTTGVINIGTGASRASTAKIQLGIDTTQVQVSNLLLEQNSIDNATSLNNGPIFIGHSQSSSSGILHLGGSTGRTSAINIGAGANVANTSTINLSNNVSNGVINVNRPLTLGYTIQPVAGQIGYSFQPSMTRVDSLPVPTTSAQQFGSILNTTTSVVPIGVWLITATQNISCTVAVGTLDYSQLVVRNTTAGGPPIAIQGNSSPVTVTIGLFNSLNVSVVNYASVASIYTFSYDVAYTGIGATYVWFGNQTNFRFTRIG